MTDLEKRIYNIVKETIVSYYNKGILDKIEEFLIRINNMSSYMFYSYQFKSEFDKIVYGDNQDYILSFIFDIMHKIVLNGLVDVVYGSTSKTMAVFSDSYSVSDDIVKIITHNKTNKNDPVVDGIFIIKMYSYDILAKLK